MIGLACALGSCLVFVTQNIFSKKLLFKESKMGERNPNKLDKMNVLFFSSLISCLLMIPLWLYSDGSALISLAQPSADIELETSKTRLLIYFFLNGTTNFSQNWFAFTTLSMTSPVTYSILSLLKRIFVIVMSIVWFGQQVSLTQSFGILLTFFGLWMYQNAKRDVDRGETKLREKSMDVLPTNTAQGKESWVRPSDDVTGVKSWLQTWVPEPLSGTPVRESKIQ
ncbi:suppressor of loss of ypt1 [Apophysomyces sp. BC1034]|nr:suppressor of loss of ypt1 [Apophysomyces sp. BC1034]